MDPIEDMPAGSVTRSRKLSKASSLALLWLVAAPFGSLAEDFLMHPLCLDALPLDFFDETGGIERALVCAAYPEAEIEGTPNGWVRAVRPINNEEGFHEGWISYKVAGHFPGLWGEGMFYLLEVGSNTGGTGIFSSLWVLEQLSELPVFWPWLNVPGGDRCNDGQLRGLELSAAKLIYTYAATPFRLLNATDQTDWRWEALRALGSPDDVSPSTFLNWRPYDDVANCAICCAGEVVNEMDLSTGNTQVTGVYVDRSQWSTMFHPDDWLKDCTKEWLNGLPIPGPKDEAAHIPLDEWLTMLDDLGRQCTNAKQQAKLDRDLKEWLAVVTSTVQRHWRQPLRLDASNRAAVLLHVDQTGRITSFETESCSGWPGFCESVQNTMDDLSLLPPPPDADAVQDGVRIRFKPD